MIHLCSGVLQKIDLPNSVGRINKIGGGVKTLPSFQKDAKKGEGKYKQEKEDKYKHVKC